MKSIQLNQGKITLVDDDVYEWASKFAWHILKTPSNIYVVRCLPRVNGKHSGVYLHREILQPDSGLEVDHKDGDGLNNRRSNLRVATGQQNKRGYRKPNANKSSRFRGVCWVPRQKTWMARIKLSGKEIYLGHHAIEEVAARAYDAAAIKYFGEFACPNFK